MFIRTQENYRKVSKSIVRLKKDLRIFLSTLFNTGGRDLPGARELLYREIKGILQCGMLFDKQVSVSPVSTYDVYSVQGGRP